MTTMLKLLAVVPTTVLLAGCVGIGDRVDTTSEIEATTDQDINGDGVILENGVETGVSSN